MINNKENRYNKLLYALNITSKIIYPVNVLHNIILSKYGYDSKYNIPLFIYLILTEKPIHTIPINIKFIYMESNEILLCIQRIIKDLNIIYIENTDNILNNKIIKYMVITI